MPTAREVQDQQSKSLYLLVTQLRQLYQQAVLQLTETHCIHLRKSQYIYC